MENSNEQMLLSLNLLKDALKGKDSQEVYYYLMQKYPQFNQFVISNKDKTIEDITFDYGIDLNIVRAFTW